METNKIIRRIRGVSSEIDELGSDYMPKLENAFNRIGISLKETDDSFKSTYQIMKELAEVWDDISDFQRAELLESVIFFAPLYGNIYRKILNMLENRLTVFSSKYYWKQLYCLKI